MRRAITLGLVSAGLTVAVGAFAPTAAQADDDGFCEEVHITNSVGRFDGWHCEDDSGTAVGGQLRDTRRDGKCVVLEVEFLDGVRQSREACDGQRWPMWVGQASDERGVLSIDVVTV